WAARGGQQFVVAAFQCGITREKLSQHGRWERRVTGGDCRGWAWVGRSARNPGGAAWVWERRLRPSKFGASPLPPPSPHPCPLPEGELAIRIKNPCAANRA